jgi:hypothetical protein
MVSDLVIPSVEQRCIIKFLVKETVKLAEILHRLNAAHGEQTLSYTSVYDWHNKFSDGCKQIFNLPLDHVHPTAACDVTLTTSKS